MKTKALLWFLALTLVPTLTKSQAVPIILPMLGASTAEGAVRYVGGRTLHSGEDIGQEINEAYASLPPAGGAIVVVADRSGNCYDFSTPVVAAVPGKYLLLEGGSGPSQIVTAPSPACLNYIPITASSAITLDYVVPGQGVSLLLHGIRNLTLTNNHCQTMGGCGSNATGIVFGGVNGGVQGATFSGLRLGGFGTALNILSSDSSVGDISFHDCTLSYNTTGFLDNQGDAEHISFDACHFQGNGTGVSSSASVSISNSTLDSNTSLAVNCSSPAACDLNDDHFESGNADSTHFLAGTGVFSVLGGDMRDNRATGNTDWWMNFAGASFLILGTALTSGGRTTTYVILNEAAGNVFVQNNSPDLLTSLYLNPQLIGPNRSIKLTTSRDGLEFNQVQSIDGPPSPAAKTALTDPTNNDAATTRNCKDFQNLRCVDSTNSGGWDGTTGDSWIKAAATNCPSTGCGVRIATGSYTGNSNPFLTGIHPITYYFDSVQFRTTASWVIPQAVVLKGQASTGVFTVGGPVVQAVVGFPTNTPVIQTGGGSINITRVEELGIDCNGIAGSTGFKANDTEEGSGLRHVTVANCPAVGIDWGDGISGHATNSGPLEDLIVTGNNGNASTVGIKVNVNGPGFRGIHGATVNLTGTSPTPTNCMVITSRGTFKDIHVEGCVNGIQVLNAGDVMLENIHCSNVTTCVHRTTGSTGPVTIRGIESNGNVVVDDVFGVTYSVTGIGSTMGDLVLDSGPSMSNAPPQVFARWEMFGIPDTPSPLGGPGKEACYYSSTVNAEKCSYNGGPFGQKVLDSATQTLTNKTLSSPVLRQATGSLNGATGSLSSPTIASPVINGPSIGTGVQGTDSKLLSSGTVAGVGSPLCLDANGGATTSGCGASLVQATKLGPSCRTGSNSYWSCTNTLTWPIPFPDANYVVTCSGIGPSDPRGNLTVAARSPSGVTVNVVTYGARSVSFSEIDCTGVGDQVSTNATAVTPRPSSMSPVQTPSSRRPPVGPRPIPEE